MRCLLLLALLSGCVRSDFDFETGALFCDGVSCPPAYRCEDGRCWRGARPALDASISFADSPLPRDAAADAEVDAACQGEKRCAIGNQPEQCDGDGGWQPLPPCPSDRPRCQLGECQPGCKQGDKVCDSQQNLYACDTQGLMQLTAHCQNACHDGACTGVCVPGRTQCKGNVAQTCGADGTWGDQACTVCENGQCKGDACVPDTQRCAPDARAVPQICSSGGTWVAQPPCAYTCSGGKCAGECNAGDAPICDGATVKTCGDDHLWHASTPCPVTCSAGACTLACDEGSTQCGGGEVEKCVAGVWRPDHACASGCIAGACGECAANSTRCADGAVAACGADGRWGMPAACLYGVCDGLGTKCGGSCTPGSSRCNGQSRELCDATGSWQLDRDCPYGCSGGQCSSCSPEPMTTTCASGACGPTKNNCGDLVPCDATCSAAGQTCGGGGVPGVCGCTPEDVCGGKCGQVTNNCLQTVTCSSANGGVSCASDALCGAGSAGPNSCCLPSTTTCSDACGPVTDNCGQTVSCSSACSDPSYVCGGTIASRCGCMKGASRCTGDTLQDCGPDGTWVDRATCPNVCTPSGCTACSLGDVSCNDNTPQTCNAGGQWTDGTACVSQTCVAGACTGACAPGQHRCTNNTPSHCGGTGNWVADATCSNQTCDAATGTCVGQCTSGATRCNGTTGNVEVCDATTVQWKVSQSCSFSCSAASGAPMCCQSDGSICTGAAGSACGGRQVTKDCGTKINCNEACAAALSCVSGTCSCVPETNTQFCARLGKTCGTVSGNDNCGNPRTVTSCGTCQYGCSSSNTCNACVPGTLDCSGPSTVRQCDLNGQPTYTECGGDTPYCSGGTCICNPGDHECSLDKTRVKVCDSSGHWVVQTTCQTGLQCDCEDVGNWACCLPQ